MFLTCQNSITGYLFSKQGIIPELFSKHSLIPHITKLHISYFIPWPSYIFHDGCNYLISPWNVILGGFLVYSDLQEK